MKFRRTMSIEGRYSGSGGRSSSLMAWRSRQTLICLFINQTKSPRLRHIVVTITVPPKLSGFSCLYVKMASWFIELMKLLCVAYLIAALEDDITTIRRQSGLLACYFVADKHAQTSRLRHHTATATTFDAKIICVQS